MIQNHSRPTTKIINKTQVLHLYMGAFDHKITQLTKNHNIDQEVLYQVGGPIRNLIRSG